MAKKIKKANSKSKTTLKPAAKSSKSLNNVVKTATKQPLAKTLVKAVSQVFGKSKDDAKALKTAKPMSKTSVKPEPKAPKVGKVAGKLAKKKGKKEGFEEDDELLVQDDDIGSEEIPDLSEFEAEEVEEEILVEAVESSDEALDAAPEAAASAANDDEIVLTDAEGRRYCRVRDCDQASTVEGYCRYHYLLLWKRIQIRRKILTDGKLERYVEELTSRYPDKFLEMIRKDLKSEKDFLTVIAELEIDESAVDNEFEDEAQSYIDEVRGLSSESSMSEEEEF